MGRFQFKTSLLERSHEITQWYSELDVAFFLRRSLDEVRLMSKEDYDQWRLYLHERRLIPSRLVGMHPKQFESLGPQWKWATAHEEAA